MRAFDLEEVYDADIAPLMAKIIDICTQHKLPMLCSNHSAGCEHADKDVRDYDHSKITLANGGRLGQSWNS